MKNKGVAVLVLIVGVAVLIYFMKKGTIHPTTCPGNEQIC